MPLLPLEFLRHILDETEYLLSAKKGLSKGKFLCDATLMRAFVRSIEIIGEASNFGVDYDIVWDAVQNKIPFLREQILRILREENAL